jgi:pimeloyl-ACP methyl ester carboxylesterase
MSHRPVLLVHGAWHGAWCWSSVVDRLAARGIETRTVDLPSAHGGPDADLHGDADVVRNAVDGLPGAVLVGHSYGGAVITEAGTHPMAARLVYVAAFALTETESLHAAGVGEPGIDELDHTGRPDVGGALQPLSGGLTALAPDRAREIFYNTCPDDVAEDAIRRLTPQAMVTFGQSPAAVAWRERPSWYAVCTADNAIHPGLQRILARRADRVVEWEADHSPFLSAPELVADLIADVAAG